MDRINTPTKQANLFGTGKHGFRDGDNNAGISPTDLNAAWFNDFQEEMMTIIEGAGLTPTVGVRTQVYQAIQLMIAAATGDYKTSVRFTTTGNVALAGLGTQAGGDWGGAVNANDRIMVKDNTVGSQNGFYLANAGAWTRATDADGVGELTPGMIVAVEEGVTQADTAWMLTNDGTITIGTTALIFVKQGGNGYTQLITGSAVCAANAMTITIDPNTVDFRSPTLTSGSKNRRTFTNSPSIVIPSGALMGGQAGLPNRLVALLIDATDSGGGVEVAVVTSSAAVGMDETGVISTQAIATAAAVTASIASNGLMTVTAVISGAITVGQQLVGAGVPAGTKVASFGTGTGGTGTYNTTCGVAVGSTTITGAAGFAVYSTVARTGVPYRFAQIVDNTQAAAGVYAAQPGLVQPVTSQALAAMLAFGFGSNYSNSTRASGAISYNPTPKWQWIYFATNTAANSTWTITVNGFALNPLGTPSNASTQVSFFVPPYSSYIVTWSVGGTLNCTVLG